MANAAAMVKLMAAKKTATSATNATVIPHARTAPETTVTVMIVIRNAKTAPETIATVMTALQKKNSSTAEDVTKLQSSVIEQSFLKAVASDLTYRLQSHRNLH